VGQGYCFVQNSLEVLLHAAELDADFTSFSSAKQLKIRIELTPLRAGGVAACCSRHFRVSLAPGTLE
jgi:hypothetical protein